MSLVYRSVTRLTPPLPPPTAVNCPQESYNSTSFPNKWKGHLREQIEKKIIQFQFYPRNTSLNFVLSIAWISSDYFEALLLPQ